MKKIIFLSLFIALVGMNAEAAETLLSAEFKITSIKYRGSNSVDYTRYEDCADCLLIEGASSPSCGSGFVIKGATAGDEESKFLRSLAMMAYASGKTVQIGREHCIKWEGAWRGQVNRIYIRD